MKTGFTCSTFDLLHPGHVQMLREVKSMCDYMIVGLQTDPTIDRPEKNKPVQSVVERYIQLSAIKYVDEIVPYTTERDLEDVLSCYDINLRAVGIEYMDKDFTGKEICNDRNIQIYYNKRDHRFSSTGLRHQVFLCEDEKVLR